MKMTDVKVGMILRSTIGSGFDPDITVTEITDKGFKYTHPPRSMKIGYSNGVPEFGTTEGGEHYGHDGIALYEPVSQSTDGTPDA